MNWRLATTLLALGLMATACGSSASTPTTNEPTVPAPTTTSVQATPSTDGPTTTSSERSDVVTVTDLAYYESESGDVLHLDVYHPRSGQDQPLVVLFHENPVFGGSKESLKSLAKIVSQRGAVVVVPSYGSRAFESAAVVSWFREQGPCAVWAAVNLGSSFGADTSELILFGEATGSFPVSTATFTPPAEIPGCDAPPAHAPIKKAIFFEHDWFFVPNVWDSVLADDPGYFAKIQPWDDLTNPTATSIHIVVGERTAAEVVRSMGGESYEDSRWVRLRDPGAELADAWAAAGTLGDDEMSFTDVSQVLTSLLVASGWNADLVTIPGAGHSLSTESSQQLVADLILEGTPATAVVALDGTGCSSTIPSHSGTRDLDIEIQNSTDNVIALVLGTYNDGFGHDDLVAYGRDISTRPDFIEALEIYEVGPHATRHVLFDHGPGRYFATCLDSTSTMIVLDDFTIAAE